LQYELFGTNAIFVVADCRQTWQNFVNIRSYYIDENASLSAMAEFLVKQDVWARAMIENHPRDEDAYWRHVAYIMAQFDGLYDGYRAAASPDWVNNEYDYNYNC